jgi:hypothetical protein
VDYVIRQSRWVREMKKDFDVHYVPAGEDGSFYEQFSDPCRE